MSKDYYKILGIDKGASKDEVKTAFRKLAHLYHPDKGGGNEAKFKEVSEAYNVLSDDKKRQQYDTFGSADSGGFSAQGGSASGWGGFGQGQDFGGFDFSQFTNGGFTAQGGSAFGGEFDLNDILGDFFGGGMGRRQRVKKGRDIRVDLEITFAESVFGVEKEFNLTRNHSSKPEKIKVKIPADIDHGQTVRLSGGGEPMADGVAGDLYISISVRRDPLFRKEGKNIVTEIELKLSDALLGLNYPLKTLDGQIELKVPEGINNGEVLRVREKGVPIDSRHRGDLLVKVKIKMPTRLSRSARNAIEELRKEGI
jgi:DnaJ-class molecular chaperone